MADDNAMVPPRQNALAGYNQDLMRALMENPDKTLTQRYAPNFDWMPDMAKEYLRQALAYAPLGFAFRGPIMSGPAAGMTHQDFATASQLARSGTTPASTGGWPNPRALENAGPNVANSSAGLATREGVTPPFNRPPQATPRPANDPRADWRDAPWQEMTFGQKKDVARAILNGEDWALKFMTPAERQQMLTWHNKEP